MDDTAESAMKHQTHCGRGGRHGGQSAMQHQARDDARPAGTALDILDERFARGEIDKVEYLEKQQLISQRTSVSKIDQSEKDPEAPRVTPRPSKPSGAR